MGRCPFARQRRSQALPILPHPSNSNTDTHLGTVPLIYLHVYLHARFSGTCECDRRQIPSAHVEVPKTDVRQGLWSGPADHGGRCSRCGKAYPVGCRAQAQPRHISGSPPCFGAPPRRCRELPTTPRRNPAAQTTRPQRRRRPNRPTTRRPRLGGGHGRLISRSRMQSVGLRRRAGRVAGRRTGRDTAGR